MKITTSFIITAVPFIFAALAFVLYVLPAKFGTRGKIIAALLMLLAAVKGIAFEYFGGHPVAPDLPDTLIWTWNAANSTLFTLMALSCVWWTRRGRVWLLPIAAVLMALWGQYEGMRIPDVREIELEYSNLPSDLDDYRILQLSDLHCSSGARRWRTQAVADLANSQHADLVCLTGDFVDGKVASRGTDLEPLASIRARDGVWCITGNHEYFLDMKAWRKWYREHGFRFLVNECVHPHDHLALAGVNDIQAKKHGKNAPDVEAAFRAAKPGDFRILLEHRPVNFIENAARFGVDLQLSGHTHGGVAWLIDILVKRHNRGFVRGLYRLGKAVLYVNSGAGMWVGFPMRFFVPAEITVFTLKRAKTGGNASTR